MVFFFFTKCVSKIEVTEYLLPILVPVSRLLYGAAIPCSPQTFFHHGSGHSLLRANIVSRKNIIRTRILFSYWVRSFRGSKGPIFKVFSFRSSTIGIKSLVWS